jgi:hypothetical protein
MRLVIAILVCVLALASQASGASQTSAFTYSLLVSNSSEFAAVRTISESSVSTPDLNYNNNGQVDSYIIQPGGGAAIISQGINSNASNFGKLGGLATFHAKVTGTNVVNSQIIMTGTSTTTVSNNRDYSKIESQSFGLGMAKPGDGDYLFTTTGNQTTVTDTVSALSPVVTIVPIDLRDNYVDKTLNVAFKQNAQELDPPADFIDQNIDFKYANLYNVPTYYGYDFTSKIGVKDTTCSSYMTYEHLN